MSRTVWKFPVFPGWYPLDVTEGARIVHVGVDPTGPQDGPTLWVELDPTEPPYRFSVGAFGTGHPLDADATTHVGSVVTPVGLVWHVYMSGDG